MLGKVNFEVEYPKSWSNVGKVKCLSFNRTLKLIKYLRHKHKGYVALDTETEDLGKKYNRIVSVQLAIDDTTGYVIILDKPFVTFTSEQLAIVKKKLKALFEDDSTNIIWIMHNAQFDICQLCNQLDVTMMGRPVIDTQLFVHLLDENRVPMHISAALKSLCVEFFNFTHYDKEAIEARGSGNLLLLPRDKFIEYSGMDAYVTFRMFLYLKKVAKKYDYWEQAKSLLIYLISRACNMFSWVSSNGFYVDRKHLMYLLSEDSPIIHRLAEINEYYKHNKKIIAVNEELYYEINHGVKSTFGASVPWIFDMNKAKYHNALFFTSKNGYMLDLPMVKGKKKVTVGKEFQKLYRSKIKCVRLFQEYQELKKLKNSYLDSIWKALLNSADSKDGRIRCRFVIDGTVTGRVSSKDPNLQQVPRSDSWVKKQVKCIYTAEPSGDPNDPNVLLQADFCANEVRFWAAISSDPYLCQLFTDSFLKGMQFRKNPSDKKIEEEAHLKGDIHKQTAGLMYDVPLKEVTKSLRQEAKTLSLGIMYQRGVASVAAQLGISREEAQKKFDKFFEKFGVGVEWSERMKKEVMKNGFVVSPLGRMRRLGDFIQKGNSFLKQAKDYPRGDEKGKSLWKLGNSFISRVQRQSVNSPVQGLASDLALMSCSLLHRYIVKNNKQWKIVNTVHDSVVMEMRASQVKEAAKVIRELFTVKNIKYAEKYFSWKMPTNIDIDFEISQGRAWKCKKCGQLVNYWKDSCGNKVKQEDGTEKTCGCKKIEEYKLNHGYGTLVGWNETDAQFKEIRKGF